MAQVQLTEEQVAFYRDNGFLIDLILFLPAWKWKN